MTRPYWLSRRTQTDGLPFVFIDTIAHRRQRKLTATLITLGLLAVTCTGALVYLVFVGT